MNPSCRQASPIRFVERKECPVCCSAHLETLLVCDFSKYPIGPLIRRLYNRDPDCLRGWDYQLERCQECSCIFQRWYGDDRFLTELYTEWVEGHIADNPDEYRPWVEILAHPFQSRDAHEIMMVSSFLGKSINDLRTLDYGAGFGLWARIARLVGTDSHAFDLSPACQNYMASKGVQIVAAEDIVAAKLQFDYINAEMVFEHVPEPAQLAKELSDVLKPGGVFKITVPNGSNVTALLRKGRWTAAKYSKHSMHAIQPLEHLNAFTPETMHMIGTISGLKPIDITYHHRLAFLRERRAIPHAPKSLAIAIARTWYRFHNPNNLYFWYQKER